MASWYPVSYHVTPSFPISKPNGEYQTVQDLRAINEAVVPLHPVVANPHIILAQILVDTNGFTVLDLKNAFFFWAVGGQSCPSAFTIFVCFLVDGSCDWVFTTIYTWAVLPQGFRDSPHLFAQMLGKDLKDN